MSLSGSVGETIAVTALQPVVPEDADSRGASADWLVHVKQATFTSDTAMVVFGNKKSRADAPSSLSLSLSLSLAHTHGL